jgi:hypothetical protein
MGFRDLFLMVKGKRDRALCLSDSPAAFDGRQPVNLISAMFSSGRNTGLRESSQHRIKTGRLVTLGVRAKAFPA